jgi:hypothetical protein
VSRLSLDPAPVFATNEPPNYLARVTFAVLGLFLALATLWFLILSGDIRVLFLGIVLAPGLIGAAWVALDAPEQGMPVLPWTVAVMFSLVIGLMVYLTVREFRPARPRP